MTAAIKAGNAFVEISARDKALRDAIEANAQRMKSFAKNVALIGASASLAAAATAIKAASTMEEQLNKFNVVFGESSAAVRAWADQFASQVGRSQRQIVEFLGATQDLLVPAGIDPAAAEAMSKTLTSLAVDVASFNNKLDADVLRDFHSALTGGGETVKKYGVLLNVATTNAELLEQGINPKSATDAQKVYARLQILLKGTTSAQGDAVRSGQSFANQSKRLVAILENLGVAIGDALLPVITSLLTKVTASVTLFSAWVQKNQDFVRTVAQLGVAAGVVAGTVFAVTKALAAYRAAALAAQAASGPAGWLALAGSLAAGAIAFKLVGDATGALEEDLKSLQDEAAASVAALQGADGVNMNVTVGMDAASALDQLDELRQKLADLKKGLDKVPATLVGFGKLKTELATEAPDLDKMREMIKEQRAELLKAADSEQKTADLKTLAEMEQQVILTGVLQTQGDVEGAQKIIDDMHMQIGDAMAVAVAADPAILGQNLSALFAVLGDAATEADKKARADVLAASSAARAAAATGDQVKAHELYVVAAEKAAALTSDVSQRLKEQAEVIKAAEMAASNDALNNLLESQKTSAEKLADKLQLVADRRRMILNGDDDGSFTLPDLDKLEEGLVDSATGFSDKMQDVRDDIGLLNGTLTETDIKLREMAALGLPSDKIVALQKEYAKLNAAKAAAEDTKKAEKLLKKQQDRADDIRDAFKTPHERIAEVAAEIDELIKAKVLDAETGKKFLNGEREKILGEVDGALADRQRGADATRESSQDLRSSAGQSMLTNVLNRTGDIERNQLQSLQRAEQHQARVVELIERGKRKATV